MLMVCLVGSEMIKREKRGEEGVWLEGVGSFLLGSTI